MEHRLKELRQSKKLKQSEVAAYLEISQALYSAYEINTRRIPVDIVLKLADFYHVSIDYLLCQSNIKYTEAELNFVRDIQSRGVEDMIKEYNLTLGDEAMSDSEQRILISLIKTFVKEK